MRADPETDLTDLLLLVLNSLLAVLPTLFDVFSFLAIPKSPYYLLTTVFTIIRRTPAQYHFGRDRNVDVESCFYRPRADF